MPVSSRGERPKNGGGAYVRNGTLYFAYGAFKSNGANCSGAGIYGISGYLPTAS